MCEDQVEASVPIHHPVEFIRDRWYHFVETLGLYGYVKAFGPFESEADAIADQQLVQRFQDNSGRAKSSVIHQELADNSTKASPVHPASGAP